MSADAIGGYAAFELPLNGREYHADALRFQSARAAFLTLLQDRQPTAVWAPWYLCESMTDSLRASGVTCRRYAIGQDFGCPDVELGPGEWLLYVNYFGVCDRHVDSVLERYPRERVVIDNAQAFFAAPRDCLANLYSPRKFVGVPDGGYLIANHPVALPDEIDHASLQRMAHLFKRLDAGAEAGFAAYQAAEASLDRQPPRRMSRLTRRLLATIDYASVRETRRANFSYLHDRLGDRNRLPVALSDASVPLCYAFLGTTETTRDALIAQRIYTPCYWPEVASDDAAPGFEAQLARSALFLPCDQRLDCAQLDEIATRVLGT
ncbi:TPA: hypothetical protein QDB15_003564 [Burkholderia vietnamiensis]|uniref:hypothetical protein n=1 Tax=Burkholderia vietnamiensis TaxID=60552 RepID=UPI0015942FDD|nr:hypothetical protein [Burkholderia vietnamiensis]MBR8216632.1 hypothetical protein [Burkholderia vietnamiensis]MCA8207322.1 hypothetical protein [Burkholderia vietnamiensis]HDR9100007.1 hypothetical protein [Burkholderia vietnamiensis]HDR9119753.1 hypothetical protein [Burkholderia vietnamiensis]HDR9170823.1 hypothetical protein [Burkholderia vietnamiensis]